MEPKSRQVHIATRAGHIQTAENQPQTIRVLRLDSGLAARREERFETFVPELRNRHGIIVTNYVTRYNPPDEALQPSADAPRRAAAAAERRTLDARKRNPQVPADLSGKKVVDLAITENG